MKKKLLITILPILALASCGAEPVYTDPSLHHNPNASLIETYRGAPVVRAGEASSHVTYLMLSPNAYIMDGTTKKEGVNIEELYYEHTIAFLAEAGTELPVPVSTVSGATFRGWAYYEGVDGVVWPKYYTTAPTEIGLPLKAIFDGTNAGGNSGSGGGSGGSGGGSSTPVSSSYGVKVNGTDVTLGTHYGINDDGYDEWYIARVELHAGDKFVIYDSGTSGTWTIKDINPYSFGDKTGSGANTATYLAVDDTAYTVKVDCKLDIYVQLMYQQDRIYFEAK